MMSIDGFDTEDEAGWKKEWGRELDIDAEKWEKGDQVNTKKRTELREAPGDNN